jgi:LysM repeat protein
MPFRIPLLPASGRAAPSRDLQWKELHRLRGTSSSAPLRSARKVLDRAGVGKVEGESFHGLLQQHLSAPSSVEKSPRFRTTMPHYPHQGNRRRTEQCAPPAVQPQRDVTRTVVDYVVRPGDTLWELAVEKFHVKVEDLVSDNRISDPRELQPGQELKVRLPSYPAQEEVVASWYGQAFQGRPMANGTPYDMYAATIAHRELPLGTRVELENPDTGQKVVAVVTDRGPFVEGRDVDLSYGLARKLSLVEKGVDRLIMRVLG